MTTLKRPSNAKEAKAVAASANKEELTFLHHEPRLKAKEATASIRALALLGGESAFAALKTYRGDKRQAVIFALIGAASSFDARRFGAEILSDDIAVLDSYDRPPIKDLALLISMRSLRELRLNKDDDTSKLSCLAALPLSKLELVWASIDLSVLAHFPQLTELKLYQDLQGLAPLGSLRALQKLTLHSMGHLAALDGIEALQELREATLDLKAVSDLGPLQKNSQLTKLFLLHCNEVEDFSPLASLPRLEHLFCRVSPMYTSGRRVLKLSSLDWVRGIKTLKTFSFTENELVEDFSPLASLAELTSLDLSGCKGLQDLTPLASLTKLEQLVLFLNDKLKDLTPLEKLTSLTSLDMAACEVSDVSSIGRMRSLQALNLSQNQEITSIAPLASLTNLRTLRLNYCSKLDDITALSSLKDLEELSLYYCTGIRDLSSLVGLPKLRTLDVRNTAVKSIPPELKRLKLKI